MVKFLGLYDAWSSFLDFSPSAHRPVDHGKGVTLVPSIKVGPYGTIKGTDLRNIRTTTKFDISRDLG